MNILLLSNMYPSEEAPYMGTFVKQWEEGIKEVNDTKINKIVITEKRNVLAKVLAYVIFFWHVIIECSFNYKKYDIIYIHFLNHSLVPFLFINKGKIPPLVLNAHGSDIFPQTSLSKQLLKVTSSIYKHASKVVVPSNNFKNQFVNKFNYNPDRIFISPSGGVKLSKFDSSYKEQEVFTIGFLGRVHSEKRWDLVVKTAKRLTKYLKNFKVIIAGGGAEEMKLKRMIQDYKVGKHIDYLGPIPADEVPDFFDQIDIFLFPSERESLGLAAVESLASGTPVVGYNNGVVNEYIRNGYNGYIYNINNVKKL